MTIRTRLAPSPTGYVHIGTLRTALFNVFLAKQSGGQFLIRIEDTDQERLVEGSVENLLTVFSQIGIRNDEGPVLQEDGTVEEIGNVGPYVQSKRLDLYRNYVQQLIDQGDAYYCFCTKERLDEMRKAQQATKQTPKYDRTCLRLSDEEISQKIQAREKHVVRLKVPEGETIVDDIIRGKVKFNNADIDDQVLLKSDGFPTYHMAVVVDDHLMNISHVIRGEEWLPSTPKHILLYKMFDWSLPQFAHVPLLLNPDKSKLSKRQGDVAVEDYLKRGYLPQTLVNFVGTLGFNPTSDQEIYSFDDLVKMFDLAKVNKSGAVLNMEKLDWMNNHYIRQLSENELAEAARPFLQANVENDVVRRALMVERERVNRLDELQERVDPYLVQPGFDGKMLVWKKADAADAKTQLENVRTFIDSMSDETLQSADAIKTALEGYVSSNNLQNGNVFWPLRVALSGLERSASPFEFIWALGKGEALTRIDRAITLLV